MIKQPDNLRLSVKTQRLSITGPGARYDTRDDWQLRGNGINFLEHIWLWQRIT